MHLKIIPSFLMLFLGANLIAQVATEIILFDLKKTDSTYVLSNPINISDNEGYDNQPCFTVDGMAVLFTSTRNGQTDIARYDIEGQYRNWMTNTEVNEYSPAPYFGKKKYFTCVRFEEDDQLLYKYSYKGKEPEVLIPNLKVGYYVWFDKNIIVTFVLGDDTETLQVSNFKHKIRYPIEENIGRSLNRVPNLFENDPNQISYISKRHGTPEIYKINPLLSESTYIVDAIEDSEDLAWTNSGTILMGKGDEIFKFQPGMDKEWKSIWIESDIPLVNITRLAVSPDGNKIAVVINE